MPVFRRLPWKPIIAALPVVLNNSKLRSPIRPSLRLTGQLKSLRGKILLTTQYNHCEWRLGATRNDMQKTMFDFILIFHVGWPAIVITVILAIIGLLRNNYRFLVAAAILAFPFSWYLSGFPAIRSPVFF